MLDLPIDSTGIAKGSRIEPTPLDKLVDKDAAVDDLNSLDVGVPIVHPEYGVGRFSGLERIESGALENEFLVLEYADSEKVYVPVGAMHLLSYYSYNSLQTAKLHRLAHDGWQRDRDKAMANAIAAAEQIWQARSQREGRLRPPCTVNREWYQSFCDSVPFDLTADQVSVIREVFADLWRDFPMDRIVCGDVGFGKTEIAMHAAFVVADAGLQIAILAPTTLLAYQHYQSFTKRFVDQPFSIELLTSAIGCAERSRVKKAIEQGTVDIVIGTHQVLAKTVSFNSLGLLIIDEEHRFGVKHKRRLTKTRKQVDTLSLSATPIPRTLAQAGTGLRELSVLGIPVPGRLPVRTITGPWDDDQVRGMCQDEMARGGQMFIVHDRVGSIKRFKRHVQSLLPDAQIVHAHGQMKPEKVQRIVHSFEQGDADILLTTTIIETGIDIPNANTLIVDRADLLGLAQLHQLRGRVGRSSKSSIALMMTASKEELSHQAQQRLETLCQAVELGAGASVASGDLEIRGAGELLGDGQSGQCEAVGFALYSEWLGRALAQLEQGGKIDPSTIATRQVEIDLSAPALLPDTYISDVNDRLSLYRRLSRAHSVQEVQALERSCEAQFGHLPLETERLYVATKCRLLCAEIGVMYLRVEGSIVLFGIDATGTAQPEVRSSLATQLGDRFIKCSSGEIKAEFATEDEQELHRLIIRTLTQCHDELLDSASRAA